MLEIKNINIRFDHKAILKQCDFTAYQSQITIVYSKSGYGKTSLLHLINDACFEFDLYEINHKTIHYENVRDYVSLAPQMPLFVNSLTMKDNILLYLSLNHTKLDQKMLDSLVLRLRLENLLLQYPQSLSGGELRRVSLVTQLLLDKPVILMDEPTASLDQEYIEDIKNIILELKKKGKIIIISTHDQDIQALGDRVYEIKDQQLNLMKETEGVDDISIDIEKTTVSKIAVYRILKKKSKYQRFKNSFMTVMVAIIVTLLGFSVIYGQGTIDALNEQLNDSVSNKMIVYKEICEAANSYDPFTVSLMNEEELSYLENHQYIQDIKAYHHGKIFDENYNNITVVDDDLHEEEIIIDESELKITFASYFDDIDYSQDIVKQYHNEGVYISQQLADILNIDENHTRIKFYLAIPQKIDSPGGYLSYASDADKYYHVDFLDCTSEYVEMNVAGVYDGGYSGYMGLYETSNGNGFGRIYIENGVYEKYIDQYKIEKDYYEECVNTVICQDTHVYPYFPNSYIVTYDIEHIETLLDDLYKQGFRYVNDYYDTFQLIEAQKENSLMIRLFASVVFVVGCIIMLSVQYVQREEVKSVYQVMKSQNILKKDYYRIMALQWLEDTLFIWIVADILGYVLSQIVNNSLNCYTNFHFFAVLMMLFIACVVCFVIPLFSHYFILRYEKC